MLRQGQLGVVVLITALVTLMSEIMLIRVFDVIFLPNIGYGVITCAMFGFALAGVYVTLMPAADTMIVRRRLLAISILLGLSIIALRPALNATPFLYQQIPIAAVRHIAAACMIYLIVLVPFLLSGLLFAYAFSSPAFEIRSLYAWDLAGAAAGCLIFLPFFRSIGPGGLLLWGGGAMMIVAAVLAQKRSARTILALFALTLFAAPLLRYGGYYDFNEQQGKRGVASARKMGKIEVTEWDPISKIDIVAGYVDPEGGGEGPKQVAYDGGSQSSHIFPFDGDLLRLRGIVQDGSEPIGRHFWQRGALLSHYLKRDSGADVLIFGSAAGQEVKAALLFNPGHVDGVELVGAVVRHGRDSYAQFNGNIFNDRRVSNRNAEGRSYLRSVTKKYDIIQIFSNHTSSSVAAGAGAAVPVYLQTVDAYEEYFRHLTDNGILHINHHFYPRLVTTGAAAWMKLGRTAFQDHVVVIERVDMDDTLPTVLIKMAPWSDEEVREIREFLAIEDSSGDVYSVVVDPLAPDASFLSPPFFSGAVPHDIVRKVQYHVAPSTDDRPFFNNIQKGFSRVSVSSDNYVNLSMASAINGRLNWPMGEYTIVAAIGGIGLVVASILVIVPLRLSGAGRASWPGKYAAMAYFACLGGGFIVIELVLVQIFMKLIGYPIYVYSTVIGTVLLGAGVGSATARLLDVNPSVRWWLPFAGVLGSGLLFWFIYPHVISAFLAEETWRRIIVAIVLIFPLSFFMGMPFPLGVLAIRDRPAGAVAWAWGMNGLFTVLGSALAGLLALFVGFRVTLLLGIAVYLLAWRCYQRLRHAGHVGLVGTTVQPASGT